MGDRPNYRYGRQPAGSSGLEFVGSRKQSRFAQYTQQFAQPSVDPAPQPVQAQPQPQPQEPAPQPVYAPAEQYYAAPYAADANQYTADQATSYAQNFQPAQEEGTQTDFTTDQTFENLFEDEPETGTVRHFPTESSIKRPMLEQTKQRVSPLRAVFATLGVVLAFGIIGVSAMYIMQTRPAVSSGLKAKAGFPVYDVVANALFKVDKKSVELNENNSLVYIVYQNDNNARFVVSQQAVPDVIKDDAQYQQFLLETDKFASMDSKIGKAYFTRPANIGSDISIVVKTDSTLMFIRGPGTTSEQDWSNLLAYLSK